jgi:alpha-1,3-glucosyltransferase
LIEFYLKVRDIPLIAELTYEHYALGIKISGIYVPLNTAGVASSSRGLVGDTVFAVLPNIKPFHTFVATITSQLVCYLINDICFNRPNFCIQIFLPKLWMAPTYKSFLTALTLCGYCSFMFGWHVHEKAIMLVLVPLRFVLVYNLFLSVMLKANFSSLIAADDHAHFRTFVIASAAGIYSLFPLIFTPSGNNYQVLSPNLLGPDL